VIACALCSEAAVCVCESCEQPACSEHARGEEVVECDACHDAREREAFATLGGLEHRAWQAAQDERRGS
jgi:hypothetical protein